MALSKLRSPQWLNWRAARWVALAATVPALWACNARRLEKPAPAPTASFIDTFQQSINRDIDIVFMVDNSLSMAPLQTKLTTNFPAFMDVLTGLPGGLPNVHIGVVSSDIGAGKYDSGDIQQCVHGGDQGRFRFAPSTNPACTTGVLNANEHFISSVNGQTNFTGTIADTFSCIATLGDKGCGFEHVFGSVLRALGADGSGAPPENANFLRPNAYLAVILITNEDDCSAPINSDFFDPTSKLVSDPLGPLTSYRCNEYGHLCGGMHPPRTVAAGGVDLSGTCTSDENGRLLRVQDVAAALKLLKQGQPNKVLVAAISGPPTPYKVEAVDPTLGDDKWPAVVHSCTAPDGLTYADPAVRVKEWVDAFGGNGVFQSICEASFRPALTRIAQEIGKKLGSPCVVGKIVDTEGNIWADNGTVAPDCRVVDHAKNDQGVKIDTPLMQCPGNNTAGATTACWALTAGGAGCGAGDHTMTFNRPGGPVTATDLNSSVACSVRACPPAGTPNPPDGC